MFRFLVVSRFIHLFACECTYRIAPQFCGNTEGILTFQPLIAAIPLLSVPCDRSTTAGATNHPVCGVVKSSTVAGQSSCHQNAHVWLYYTALSGRIKKKKKKRIVTGIKIQ